MCLFFDLGLDYFSCRACSKESVNEDDKKEALEGGLEPEDKPVGHDQE